MRRAALCAPLSCALVVLGATPARAQSCPASNVPHLTGTWSTLPYGMPINPISATLMHDGKVLIIAGSENDASNNGPEAESYRAAVWDPTGATQSSIAVQSLTYDVFCSGTSLLGDGRAFVVGGTSDYSFTGDNRASIFDPATGRFLQSQSMADGRWYGTATTLGDGRIMAFSGLGLSGATNNTVEIYNVASPGAGWTSPATAPFVPPLYPRMHLLPGGKVFYTGQGSGTGNATSWLFDPVARSWAASAAPVVNRSYGSTVLLPLLPPGYAPRVMALGGNSPATSSTELIDLSAAAPAWSPGPSMSTGRIQMNAVLLPDGRVLAEGGSNNNESPDMPGKRADLYDPVSNTMRSAGTAAFSRLYHSAALLLPDATVMSVGSNPGSRGSYQPAIEIYSPPYLFDANDQPVSSRPAITGVSATRLGYGAPLSVSYASASAIRAAVLVRPGSATHSVDMDQRLVGLCGPAPQPPCTGAGTLSLTTPPDGSVAPPGYYMLFLIDSAGVPSRAQFVQLTPFAGAPPVGAISSPAGGVTIVAGGTVNFASPGGAARYSWVFPGGSPATSAAQSPGAVRFSTPGTYTASLTAIDAAGNTDPSPPTRTITVLPTAPDFDIAVSPSVVAVGPGQTARFTVTITPSGGFAGAVALAVGSESGFPAGISSGGFAPATVSGSGSSTLTMNVGGSTTPYALSLTVTGTSGALSHQASTTLLVGLAPPATLSAAPGSGQVALSWPPSAGASGYTVQRSLVSGGPYVAVACPGGTSYTDTGLTNGTRYFYVVSAVFTGGPNAGGASAASPEASATPTGSAPPPPTNLSAGACSASVSLSWSASAGATSYRVKRATTPGGPYATLASTGTTSYTDASAANGVTYYYVVSALSGTTESGNSSEVSASPPGALPAAPTGLAASTPKGPKGRIQLGWTPSTGPGVTANNVYRRAASGAYGPTPIATLAPSTGFTDSRLAPGTYCYVVTAVNCSGESVRSNESCATAR